MKKLYIFSFLFLLGLAVYAHDIEVKNADGVTIYYNWINDSTELAVGYHTASAGSGSYYTYHDYTGNVAIPESVFYNGTTYNVTSIDTEAFAYCKGLISVTVPSSIKSIGNRAFVYNNDLESIIVNKDNPQYDTRDNCNAIIESNTNILIVGCKNTTIPLNVTGIGIRAFEGCSSLTSLTIPTSVTSIAEYAFEGCSSLTSLTIPASVTSIEKRVFGSCGNLSSIIVSPENAKYDSRDNCNAIIETENNMQIAACKNTNIPQSVTSIAEYAFYQCSGLISIEIPDNITTIENNAFRDCEDLLSVKIGTGVTIIEDNTFRGCKALKTITFGANVQEIKQGALSNCNNLGNIISLNMVPPTLAQNIFPAVYWRNKAKNIIIQVPLGCLEAYRNADVWNRFTYILEGDFSDPSEVHIIDALNFPDEKFRDYLKSQEYGKDGVLTQKEIAGITALNVSNMGISDLTGIEYFTALKKLLCYKNNLTELNLSANKQLKELDCYSNHIMGIKMDSLIASLPTLNEGEGSLYVLDATEEGNICFAEQVTSAKSKGWIVYHYTGSDWQEYEGRESGILISEENFPDEKFREYLMKQDYGKDMIITNDEIKTITSININAYNYSYDRAEGEITSLKGIEHFTFLQSLLCNGNKLTNLDISMNSRLTTLSCLNNPLTEIDVSKNTELAELSCGGRFTRLDVSNNTKLITLHCESNGLTELDVSNNTALTSLSCHFTGLRSLDVSKNLALTSLSCLQNFSLTSIEISKNKALTWLSCPQNKLSELDVSKNTALTYLFCPYNQLTSLDVSKNAELTELACMGNKLTKLDVSKNLKLKTLKCQQNKINGERMYQLIESLPIQTSATLCVINLQVADENICTKDQVKKANEKGWKVMWGYEYYNSGPAGYHPYYYDYEGSDSEDVYIDEGNFPDDNFRAFLLEQSYGKDGVITAEERNNIKTLRVDQRRISSLKGIEYFTKLTKLDCHSNNITTLDISKNVELISLECFYNKLTSLDVSKNTELVSLYCYNNQLANLDISNNTALANLYSSYNQLTSLDVSKNTALTYLSIEGNQIVNFDISNNVALTYLYCAYNQLGSLDISNNTALAGLSCYSNQLTNLNVSKNTALSWLYCFDNQMTSLDVSNNIELKELYCSNNRLNGIDFSNNAALLWLDCSNNQLTSLDVSNNTSLKELYCNNNQLTSIDFSNNTALTKLNIYSNRIRVDEMQALVNSLPVQTDAQLGVVSLSDESEGNVCTTVQVAMAKEKGWRVQAYDGYWWSDYEGSIDTVNIPDIMLDKNTKTPVYDLRGHKITSPKKGVYINNGRKVLVK